MPAAPRYPYLHVAVSGDDAELVSDRLWTLGCLGVEERDGTTLNVPDAGESVTLVASFGDEEAARRAAARLDQPASLRFVEGDGWREAWKAFFEPTKLGERLLLRPSWREVEPGPDEVVLTIDPGYAFGSGIHETTRLVLREIDARTRGGERVLDVGCGSGILAIAARLLGAASAVAVDVDPDAVRTAEENASRNGTTLAASATPIDDVAGTYDLVLANIQAPILLAMRDALVARVAAGGLLVLSGILEEAHEEVTAAYVAAGLAPEASPKENEWRALVFRR
ncbi:MAG: 50S ribosomal protein L11 methyltransferase [Myxococcota bacterium]